jgi:hypothetical protein
MFCPGCGKQLPEGYADATCPFCGASFKQQALPGVLPGGIPWEKRREMGFLPALLDNLRLCLFDPSKFFAEMPKRENVGAALFYIALLGWLGGLGGIVWDRIMEGPRNQFLQSFGIPVPEPTLNPSVRTAITLAMSILLPVILVLVAFIAAGIFHVALWILGGAKEGFEATLRSYCYAAGSTSLFQWIPFCGGLIGLIWWLILQVYGFSRVHEISGGKAALAVVFPMALCCLFLFAAAIIFASFFLTLLKGGALA